MENNKEAQMKNKELAVVFNTTPRQITRWRNAGMPADDLIESFAWLCCRKAKGRMAEPIAELHEAAKTAGHARAFLAASVFWLLRMESVIEEMRRARAAGGMEYVRGIDPETDALVDRMTAWAGAHGLKN